ncbi:anaerobic ribonucleoside-triphosphate reductase [Melaminivora sp.]
MNHVTTIETSALAAAELYLLDTERQPCEVWTRVMGYHRPVASFNVGKQGEHAERQFFKEQ